MHDQQAVHFFKEIPLIEDCSDSVSSVGNEGEVFHASLSYVKFCEKVGGV